MLSTIIFPEATFIVLLRIALYRSCLCNLSLNYKFYCMISRILLTGKSLLLLSSFAFVLSSCDKDEDDTPTETEYTIMGNANGSQEAPNRVTTTASGTITGTYNKTTNMLHYTITWTGLSGNPSAMHFHGPADPGVAAGVLIPITGFTAATSGSVAAMATLTDAQESDMINGKWYYNIHTAANPGGEIRGQLFAIR